MSETSILRDGRRYIETLLKIKTKENKVVPLKLNAPQKRLMDIIERQQREGRPIRIIILKARQMGFSTLTEAAIFFRTANYENIESRIVTHMSEATANLYGMFRLYYEELPDRLKPQTRNSNAKELVFDVPTGKAGVGLRSRVKCNTAGSDGIGRSDTITNLHISEFAFWEGDKTATYVSLMQAVPYKPNTMVVIESTANGFNEFKEMWDSAVAGELDFEPLFVAWYELEDYRREYDGSPLTAEEEELKRLYSLDNEQLMWRRWTIKNECKGSVDYFHQEYPSNPDEAFISSGTPVFDTAIIAARIAELEKEYKERPYSEGAFLYQWNDPGTRDAVKNDSIEWRDGGAGYIRIYEPPKGGVPYVIGGDTKGEGHDCFAATVINNATGKRAATLHMDISDSGEFTYQVYCLGKYYNTALVGIEINFNGHPIEELQRLRYPKQYVRRKYDDYRKRTEEKFGFKTDGNTRPIIIDKEIALIRENIELFTDVAFLRECMTFVYDDNGRPDAMAGKHDDILFSDMIANEIRPQQRFCEAVPEKEKKEWHKSMFEDYYAASKEEKKYLLEKWGEPKRWEH